MRAAEVWGPHFVGVCCQCRRDIEPEHRVRWVRNVWMHLHCGWKRASDNVMVRP